VKVTLYYRRYGVYDKRGETEVPGQFTDWAYQGEPEGSRSWDERLRFHEDKLIAALPAGFLPVPPSRILLTVSDDLGGTGQSQLDRFKPFAKYFDAYALDLSMDESAAALEAAAKSAVSS
jgi:hypothetical protein